MHLRSLLQFCILVFVCEGCENILNRPFLDVLDGDIDDVIAEMFRGDVEDIREVFISYGGQKVDYTELADNWLFQKYLKDSGMLMQMRPEKLEEEERKAFFINVYNFFTIHAVIDYAQTHGLPNSTKSIPNFWSSYCYNIGGLDYSLDDIEHGVLRANRGTASHPPFEDSDPRLEVAMKELDQRVHFALNCGGLSCPDIEVYNGAGNISEELDNAAYEFLVREVTVNLEQEAVVVELSKILEWYGTDFGDDERELVEWIKDHVNDQNIKLDLEKALSGKFSVKYRDYDWTLNNL